MSEALALNTIRRRIREDPFLLEHRKFLLNAIEEEGNPRSILGAYRAGRRGSAKDQLLKEMHHHNGLLALSGMVGDPLMGFAEVAKTDRGFIIANNKLIKPDSSFIVLDIDGLVRKLHFMDPKDPSEVFVDSDNSFFDLSTQHGSIKNIRSHVEEMIQKYTPRFVISESPREFESPKELGYKQASFFKKQASNKKKVEGQEKVKSWLFFILKHKLHRKNSYPDPELVAKMPSHIVGMLHELRVVEATRRLKSLSLIDKFYRYSLKSDENNVGLDVGLDVDKAGKVKMNLQVKSTDYSIKFYKKKYSEEYRKANSIFCINPRNKRIDEVMKEILEMIEKLTGKTYKVSDEMLRKAA